MAVRTFSTTKEILKFEGASKNDYWRRFSALLALSVVIATMGMTRNSGAVIIAAMLIAPLMTPILGIAAAMVTGQTKRLLRLLAIVLVAAGCAVLLAWLIVFLADIPLGIRIPPEVRARTDPGIEDLIVALASGSAAAFVQIQKKEISLLPGAAIGVALVPPLSAAGILLYFGEPLQARDATVLFLTNLAAIILAAVAVYVSAGLHPWRSAHKRRKVGFTAGFSATILVLLVIVWHLGSETLRRYRETRLEEDVAALVRDWAQDTSVEILRVEVNHNRRLADLWVVIDLPLEARTRLATVEALIPEELEGNKLLFGLRGILGTDYEVSFRYQVRYAGLVSLEEGAQTEAPPVDSDGDTAPQPSD